MCVMALKIPEIINKQECIPVGCVPAARWPYTAVCSRGGVCSGGCLLQRGGGAWCEGGCQLWGECLLWGVPGPRGCLLWGVCLVWGVSALGGVPGLGVVCSEGVCLVRGGGVSQHALRQTPSPPVDRILDTRLWKYYLGLTSLRPVIMKINRLPWVKREIAI